MWVRCVGAMCRCDVCAMCGCDVWVRCVGAMCVRCVGAMCGCDVEVQCDVFFYVLELFYFIWSKKPNRRTQTTHPFNGVFRLCQIVKADLMCAWVRCDVCAMCFSMFSNLFYFVQMGEPKQHTSLTVFPIVKTLKGI